MKTRKHNLNTIAVGVALALGSMSALAAPPTNPASNGAKEIIKAETNAVTRGPSFDRAEQTGLCLIESVVSLLAARTDSFGCGFKSYDLAVYTTDNDGVGEAHIGDGAGGGGTSLTASLGPVTGIGTLCNVKNVPNSKLSGVGVEIYSGSHGWSNKNEIFNSNADIRLKDPQAIDPPKFINYREVNIKDYFKQLTGTWEFDWGLEDIKKQRLTPVNFYYPVQKWMELSWYNHENGGEGELYVHKYKMIPRSANGCRISVDSAENGLYNGSGEFEFSGTVTVGAKPFTF